MSTSCSKHVIERVAGKALPQKPEAFAHHSARRELPSSTSARNGVQRI